MTDFVASSMKIAILSVSPAMAPTSNRRGRFGPATTSGFEGSGAALAIAGGRRDGEKRGRSRVAFSELNGIFHKGLPGRAVRLSEMLRVSGVAPWTATGADPVWPA